MLSETLRKGSGRGRRNIERYREAAMRTLDQLKWCINYLHRIRKNNIAKGLERNRLRIMERIR
jgi:hypothetical protein